MCKNLMLIGIKDTTRLEEFLSVASTYMTKTDDHGFGYHALKADGSTFNERWLDTKYAMNGDPQTDSDRSLLKKMGDMIFQPKTRYNHVGSKDFSTVKTVMAHARFATCEKTLENVHPFTYEGTTLIHNGVISNSGQLTKKISTCDSEAILHEYITANVKDDPKNIQQAVDPLIGWYACGVMSKKGNVEYIDIFKDAKTDLWCTHIDDLGCTAFCTKNDIIFSTLKDLGMTDHNSAYSVTGNSFIRLNAITGEVISKHTFSSEYKSKFNNTKPADKNVSRLPVTGKGIYYSQGKLMHPNMLTHSDLDDFADGMDEIDKMEVNDLEVTQRYVFLRAKYNDLWQKDVAV